MDQLALSLSSPARLTDPLGSHEAAADVQARRDNEMAQVLEALRKWPSSTSRELAKRSGLDRYLVARRLPDLETLQLVRAKVFSADMARVDREVDASMEPCSESARHLHSMRWWPVEIEQ